MENYQRHIKVCFFKIKNCKRVLTGVTQWLEDWPVHRRVLGLIKCENKNEDDLNVHKR